MSATQPTLIFVHIPKTAGTTFSRMFRLKFGLWPPSNLFHHSLSFGFNNLPTNGERIQLIRKLPPTKRKQIRLYQGHFGFGVHEFLPLETIYLTFLRDPVERVVSLYFMLIRDPRHEIKDISLEEFVTCGKRYRNFYVDNGQVRALAGKYGEYLNVPFGKCTESHLKQAIANIEEHFVLAGISERFDESLLVLKHKLGWRSSFYATANVGKGRQKVRELPREIRAAVKKHNQLDRQFYDFAVDRLNREIENSTPSFANELERFQRGNRIYNTLAGPIISTMPRVKQTCQRIGIIR